MQNLIDELTNDPENFGWAAMTNTEVVVAINADTQDAPRTLTSNQIIQYLSERNLWSTLEAVAANDEHPAQGLARGALKMADHPTATLDPHNQHAALVGALVASGVITEADKDALLALATVKRSRAKLIGFGTVEEKHVRWARG